MTTETEKKKSVSKPLNKIGKEFKILKVNLLSNEEYCNFIPEALKKKIIEVDELIEELIADYSFDNLTHIYNSPNANIIEFVKLKKFSDIKVDDLDLTTL